MGLIDPSRNVANAALGPPLSGSKFLLNSAGLKDHPLPAIAGFGRRPLLNTKFYGHLTSIPRLPVADEVFNVYGDDHPSRRTVPFRIPSKKAR